jgi:hypothetical protein
MAAYELVLGSTVLFPWPWRRRGKSGVGFGAGPRAFVPAFGRVVRTGPPPGGSARHGRRHGHDEPRRHVRAGLQPAERVAVA